MITGADKIGITLVTEGVGTTVIWNSGTRRYMYLQSNGNGGKVLYEFLLTMFLNFKFNQVNLSTKLLRSRSKM